MDRFIKNTLITKYVHRQLTGQARGIVTCLQNNSYVQTVPVTCTITTILGNTDQLHILMHLHLKYAEIQFYKYIS